MMGRNMFAAAEVERIRDLLRKKVRATSSEQKAIRASLRRIGFFITDFAITMDGFTMSDFDDLVEHGEITVSGDMQQGPSRPPSITRAGRVPPTANRVRQREAGVVLPDVLDRNMKVVFCGTAVGEHSARRGAYYAGPGNQFWNILAEIGLTPLRLPPEQFASLAQYGIGLTDLVKRRFGQDDILSRADFDVEEFKEKIEKYAPKAVGFNGKKAAQLVLASPSVEYGLQTDKIGTAALFVLPSTSGAARGFWNPRYWFHLARFVG